MVNNLLILTLINIFFLSCKERGDEKWTEVVIENIPRDTIKNHILIFDEGFNKDSLFIYSQNRLLYSNLISTSKTLGKADDTQINKKYKKIDIKIKHNGIIEIDTNLVLNAKNDYWVIWKKDGRLEMGGTNKQPMYK